VLAFGIIENGRSWLFSTKLGVVWPLIIDQRIVHLTPHMFPCQRSHSSIFGEDHFLGKNPITFLDLWWRPFLGQNPYVFAFSVIEYGRSCYFLTKLGVVWPLIIDQRLIHLTYGFLPKKWSPP
jgi:hypothetical protein